MEKIWKPLLVGLVAAGFVAAAVFYVPSGEVGGAAAAAVGALLVVGGLSVGFLSASGKESEIAVESVNKDLDRLKKEVKGREKTIEDYKTKLVESTSLRRALSAIARL